MDGLQRIVNKGAHEGRCPLVQDDVMDRRLREEGRGSREEVRGNRFEGRGKR
jgi:hypothetical protein